MAGIRKIIRAALAILFGGFFVAILAGVVGEFFIELAREKGLYTNPSNKLDAAMSAFSSFVQNQWFLMVATAVGFLTIGMWLDSLLRRQEARQLDSTEKPATQSTDTDAIGAQAQLKKQERLASPQKLDPFPNGLYVAKMWVQLTHLDRGDAYLNISFFNGTGERLIFDAIRGRISVFEWSQATKKKICELRGAAFYEMIEPRCDDYEDYDFTVVLSIPRLLIAPWSNWSVTHLYDLKFNEFDIFVRSLVDTSKVARLPLWDGVQLVKMHDRLVSNKILDIVMGRADDLPVRPFKSPDAVPSPQPKPDTEP